MEAPKTYHLLYRPACPEEGTTDRIVDIVEADETDSAWMQAEAAPDLIAMQLEAESIEEIPFELVQLGF